MSAIESITDALSGPNGQLSRHNWDERVKILCMGYPSLAAGIAELLEEHGHPIPGPLRHARHNIEQERGKRHRFREQHTEGHDFPW